MAPAGDAMNPPSPSASPELVRARELLADGQWHDYEKVVRELTPLVTPGRASRAAEDSRREQARRRARRAGVPLEQMPVRVRDPDPDRVRQTGARVILSKMFHGAGFEIDPPGRSAKKRIRDPGAR